MDDGHGVAVDGSGNVYLTGYFQNTVSFGGSTLSSQSDRDIYLASFDSSGKHRWSKGFGGTSFDYGYGVAADGSGNVYLTGSFGRLVNFGGSTLSSQSSDDIYLASFDSSGKHRWSKRFGGSGTDIGYALAADSSGNIYITGSFTTSVDLGGSTFTSQGSYDVFLASFDAQGKHRWSRSHGASNYDYGYAIAADSKGGACSTGHFYYSVDFGGGPLKSKGVEDIYLLKLE
jgi:hypothetical protein